MSPLRPSNFPSSSGPRAWPGLALRVVGSALILALLGHFLHFERLWAAMRRMPLGLWLVVLGGYLSAHVIGVLKWRLMVNLAGAGVTFAQAARCYFAGLFGTLFLPSIVGGDVVRLGLALRLARSRAAAVLGSVLDRMLDVVALAGVAGLGAILLPGALDPRSRRVFWLLAAAVALGLVVTAAVLVMVPARRFSHRMRRRFVRLRRAARAMSSRPQYVLLALAMGVTVQSSFVLLAAVVAKACGLHLAVRVWLFAWPLAKLSALLPVTLGGIGVREVALAALLAPFGAPPVVTVAVGLVWETLIVSGGLLAGLASLLLGRFSAATATPLAAVPAVVSSTPAASRSERAPTTSG
jgi:uncharacterized membrane protein YbhN (UPF0104 family)